MDVRHCVIPALLCSWPWTVTAQMDSLRTIQLDAAAVVRPHPSASSLSSLPVQRLDTLLFRRRGITGTADALRRMHGIRLRDYGGAGGLKTVSVRGLGASHTGMMLDGMPFSDARSGIVDIGRISLERLAGIEVHTAGTPELLCPVRQASAAANIVMQSLGTPISPATEETSHIRHSPQPHGAARLTQAAFGTWNPALQFSMQPHRRTVLSTVTDYHYGKNDYPFLVRNGTATHRERRQSSRMDDWHAEINALHHLPNEHGRIVGKAAYTHNKRQLPGPVILYTNIHDEQLTEQNATVQARYDGPAGKGWQLMAGTQFSWQECRHTERGGQYPEGRLQQNYRQRNTYATAGAAWTHGAFSAAYAADYTLHALHASLTDVGNVRRHSALQGFSMRWEQHRILLTARLIHALHVTHGDQLPRTSAATQNHIQRWSPSVSVRWDASPAPSGSHRTLLSFRAHYQAFFRPPTFTENYYYHLGNPRLRAESTRQLGLGFTWERRTQDPLTLVRITTDAYLNHVHDKITSLPYNLFVWHTINLGIVRAAGMDVSGEVEISPAPRHRLFFASSYGLQRATDRTDKTSTRYGRQLAYLPVHCATASLAWENPWLHTAISLVAASRQWATHEHVPGTDVAGYTEWGFSLYRSLRLGQRWRADLRADLINAFDRQYEIIRRYPMPGRAYKLSATLHF